MENPSRSSVSSFRVTVVFEGESLGQLVEAAQAFASDLETLGPVGEPPILSEEFSLSTSGWSYRCQASDKGSSS